jgi:hypothetical protein
MAYLSHELARLANYGVCSPYFLRALNVAVSGALLVLLYYCRQAVSYCEVKVVSMVH